MRFVSSPPMSFRKSGALMPAAHTVSSAGIFLPAAVVTPSGGDLRDALPGQHLHVQSAQQLRGGLRQPLRHRGQDARRRLDDRQAHVLLRVDAIEPVGHQLARALVQLGGELHAGRAGADDGDVQLLGAERLALRVGADAGVDQPAMEQLRLVRPVEADRVLARAGRAEIVAVAADRDDERVVRDLAARNQLPPVLVPGRRDQDDPPRAIEAVHLAQLEAEMVPARLREVVERMLVEVHGAGGELVQQRLPQVRARAVDERHERLPAAAERVAQARRELDAARAAADDDDLVQTCSVV